MSKNNTLIKQTKQNITYLNTMVKKLNIIITYKQ